MTSTPSCKQLNDFKKHLFKNEDFARNALCDYFQNALEGELTELFCVADNEATRPAGTIA